MPAVRDEASPDGGATPIAPEDAGAAELRRALNNTAQIRVARRIQDALEESSAESGAASQAPGPSGARPTPPPEAKGPTLGGRTERIPTVQPLVRITGELPAAWPGRTIEPLAEHDVVVEASRPPASSRSEVPPAPAPGFPVRNVLIASGVGVATIALLAFITSGTGSPDTSNSAPAPEVKSAPAPTAVPPRVSASPNPSPPASPAPPPASVEPPAKSASAKPPRPPKSSSPGSAPKPPPSPPVPPPPPSTALPPRPFDR